MGLFSSNATYSYAEAILLIHPSSALIVILVGPMLSVNRLLTHGTLSFLIMLKAK